MNYSLSILLIRKVFLSSFFFFFSCWYLNSFSFLNKIFIISWIVFAANSCIKVLITNTLKCVLIWKWGGFPGDSEGKASVCLQFRRPGFDPPVGKIPWRRKWQPTPLLLPGEFHGQRSLVGYSLWDRRETHRTEQLHFSFGNRVIADVIDCDEVTLEKGQPLTHYDWISYREGEVCTQAHIQGEDHMKVKMTICKPRQSPGMDLPT